MHSSSVRHYKIKYIKESNNHCNLKNMFYLLFVYLFIAFCWFFIVACGLSLGAVNACSSLVAVRSLLFVATSLVAEHGLKDAYRLR